MNLHPGRIFELRFLRICIVERQHILETRSTDRLRPNSEDGPSFDLKTREDIPISQKTDLSDRMVAHRVGEVNVEVTCSDLFWYLAHARVRSYFHGVKVYGCS